MFERYVNKDFGGWGTCCRIFIGDKDEIVRVYNKIKGKGKYFQSTRYGGTPVAEFFEFIGDSFFDTDKRSALVFSDYYSDYDSKNISQCFVVSETAARQALKQVDLREKYLRFNCLGEEVINLFNAELKKLIDKDFADYAKSSFVIVSDIRGGCKCKVRCYPELFIKIIYENDLDEDHDRYMCRHMSPFEKMLFALAEKALLTKEEDYGEKEWWAERTVFDFFSKNQKEIEKCISENKSIIALKEKVKEFKDKRDEYRCEAKDFANRAEERYHSLCRELIKSINTNGAYRALEFCEGDYSVKVYPRLYNSNRVACCCVEATINDRDAMQCADDQIAGFSYYIRNNKLRGLQALSVFLESVQRRHSPINGTDVYYAKLEERWHCEDKSVAELEQILEQIIRAHLCDATMLGINKCLEAWNFANSVLAANGVRIAPFHGSIYDDFKYETFFTIEDDVSKLWDSIVRARGEEHNPYLRQTVFMSKKATRVWEAIASALKSIENDTLKCRNLTIRTDAFYKVQQTHSIQIIEVEGCPVENIVSDEVEEISASDLTKALCGVIFSTEIYKNTDWKRIICINYGTQFSDEVCKSANLLKVLAMTLRQNDDQ